MSKWQVVRVGTNYKVEEIDTGKKHSEHFNMDKANATVAYLEDLETGARKKPMGRTTKFNRRVYNGIGGFGRVG